jgi:hypothetical protein
MEYFRDRAAFATPSAFTVKRENRYPLTTATVTAVPQQPMVYEII